MATEQRYDTIEIEPIGGSIGAVIHGVDLGAPLSNRQAKEVHDAFLEHSVVFFRDQKLDDPERQKRAARLFGEPVAIPFVKSLDGHPEIIDIVKEAEDAGKYNFGGSWHTDTTFLETPALGSLLYALEVPSRGGDTLFADQYAAYETLSDGMRRLLDGLTAVHSGSRSYGSQSKFQGGKNQSVSMTIDANADGDRLIEHPVVRTHPETGRKCLFVNPNYTLRLKDMTEAESKPLLDFLYAHAIRDEFICRFRWQAGSVAVWDNRCTMHRAVNDYDGARRHVRRVTLQGDRPH
ncbi:TauD/TfdA family dioxygenase [Thalassobaculum sp.]|uniref:TauD/TfdA dioxygenase family protein n=1 Tax=Thalassobaculum sp. TaxID=2022740 RepID=UPI0032EDD6AB